jgi:hypothetical protein
MLPEPLVSYFVVGTVFSLCCTRFIAVLRILSLDAIQSEKVSVMYVLCEEVPL